MLHRRKRPTAAHLISMWTALTHRRRGAGRLLVNEAVRWAAERHGTVLKLMVTCNNQPALDFYERLGFTRTGRTEPYPNDPAVIEYEMSLKNAAATPNVSMNPWARMQAQRFRPERTKTAPRIKPAMPESTIPLGLCRSVRNRKARTAPERPPSRKPSICLLLLRLGSADSPGS